MNGYSKMRANTLNAISMDLSTFNFSPPKPQPDPSKPQEEEEEFEGEKFGVTSSRNCSSASQRFRDTNHGNNNNEKSNGTIIGGAVRRAFSMRKTSSLVGDGYWRIHDTGDGQAIEEEEEKRRMRKKGGRIFRACKRFFKYF